MLEGIHSTFFDSTDAGEDGGELKNLAGNEPNLPHDFSSLFTDLIGEPFIDAVSMSDEGENLADSDSNDGEMVGYLAARKMSPQKQVIIMSEKRPQRKCTQFSQTCTQTTSSQSDQNETSKKGFTERTSNSIPNVPRINVDDLEQKGKCTSKNALNARINRMKKKQYITDLEGQVDVLSKENTDIKEKLEIKTQKLTEAQKEIEYLRSVISNQNGLMSLLGNISNTAGVKLNASLVFANNNNENSDKTNSDTCRNSPSSLKRQLVPDDPSDKSDTVSVKRTRNGLYLVNEKEENAATNPMRNDSPKVLKERNHNDVTKLQNQASNPDQPTTGAKSSELRNVKAKRTKK